MKKWKITPEYRYQWRQKNLEKIRIYDREWKRKAWKKNPEKYRETERLRWKRLKARPEWHKKHKEYMKIYLKKWRKDNPKYAEQHRKHANERQRNNGKKIYQQRMKRPNERFTAIIRSRINQALKSQSGRKLANTERLIGITIPELKKYLENKFQIGMNWENHGLYGWHVDHCLPLSSFDLTDSEEQKKAFHFTNLQPLWAKDNLCKHAKIS